MTSEQTQRMREAEIDELINELNHDADEHKAFVPSDKSYQRMRHGSVRAISQLRSDLAAMTERAERAENSAGALDEVVCVLNRELRKTEDDLTEAREQLAEAREALEMGEREWGKRDTFLLHPEKKALQKIRDALSRLSPSPKQTAGGGEG